MTSPCTCQWAVHIYTQYTEPYLHHRITCHTLDCIDIYAQYAEPYLRHRTTCSTLGCIASGGTQTHWKSAMYMCCVAHILDIMRIRVRRARGSTCGEFRVFLHDVMWGGTIDGYCGRP